MRAGGEGGGKGTRRGSTGTGTRSCRRGPPHLPTSFSPSSLPQPLSPRPHASPSPRPVPPASPPLPFPPLPCPAHRFRDIRPRFQLQQVTAKTTELAMADLDKYYKVGGRGGDWGLGRGGEGRGGEGRSGAWRKERGGLCGVYGEPHSPCATPPTSRHLPQALEKALLVFHTSKMADINKIIKEMWQKTYRGQVRGRKGRWRRGVVQQAGWVGSGWEWG